jgi:CDP-glycerol glycerophosphotransferase (TagB/SpsB family)
MEDKFRSGCRKRVLQEVANLFQALKRYYNSHFDSYFMRAIHVLYLLVGDIAYLTTSLLPTNHNLWVFGSWQGEEYADNSKYLFEYVCKNHPELRAVWLTRDKTALDLVTERGFEAHLIGSARAFLLRMGSCILILSSDLSDVGSSWRRPPNVKIVSLWHGTPLKKIEFDVPTTSVDEHPLFCRFKLLPLNKTTLPYDLHIAASEEAKETLASAFRAPPETVAVTGYPRTDAFFDLTRETTPVMTALSDAKKKGFSIGIYMPTHRLEGQNSIRFLIKDLKAIESQLADMHVLLLVKVHFFHLRELASLKDRLNSVLFVEEKDINQDIYTILPETDFLITDYSSVYFDYLLLNKPIIFAPFDIEQYVENDRALYYNYDGVTPGPKARNWREVVECIEDILTKSDAYEDERRRVSRMFNAYDGGCSSKRVYDAIVTTLL